MQTRNNFTFLRFSKRSANIPRVCGAGESKTPRFSFPGPLSFRAGAPSWGSKDRRPFGDVKGSDLRLVRSLFLDYGSDIGQPPADPMPSCARSSLHPLAFGRVRRWRHRRFVSLQPCALGTKCLRVRGPPIGSDTSQPAGSFTSGRYARRVTLSVSPADRQSARR